MTKLKGTVLLLVLLLGLAPLHAQEADDSPYFSISSNKTYATGEKPSIQLWGSKVATLEFRVYRVNDPVKFFANLQDQHQFGGRAPRIPRQQTWIERFHNWKHNLWADIRDFFRAQFSAASREKIRLWQADREKKPVSQVEQFAQLPLLNSQQLVARWQMNIPAAENRWAARTIPIDVKEKGLYLVEASNGTLQAYTIIIVSDMAMITKVSAGDITAYVVHRQTGKPLPDVPVSMWTEKRKQLTSDTDRNGLASFTNLPQEKTEELTVIARQGDDVAVTAPFTYLLNHDPERNTVGYAYTDRPIYRPGDTVHFKGIIRTQQPLGYSIPTIREVKIEIRDPEYKPTFQKTLPVSAMGTYCGDFPLPAGAALGSYYISASGSTESSFGGTNFEVEEYKKPEYNVRVSVSKPRVMQGESITATIDARYYFGEPVANAKVTYVVHQSTAWTGLSEEPDSEESGDYASEGGDEGDGEGGYEYAGEQTQETDGKLNAEGKLVITLPTSVNKEKNDVNYRIEARVTDEGNREISGHNVVLATYGPFQIAPQLESWVATVNDTVNIKVVARDYDSKPILTPFRVEVERWSYVDRKSVWNHVTTLNGSTDAAGNASLQYRVTEAGEIRFRAIAPTNINREVEGSHYLWVAGESRAWWGKRNKQIQFIPDKKKYAAGETARILITTGVDDAYVLVGVEGPVLYKKEVVHATGGSFTYSLPIRKEYVPNVFLSATFISKNELYRGSKSLNVPADEHRLNITIETSKPQFQPGEAALYNVKLTDASGKPVAAEFSLGVVDEAIYGLRPDRARDMMKEFYGHRWSAVSDADSLSYQFTGTAGKRRMQLAFDGTRPHNAFAQIKPERLVEPKIRKAFPDTNYWAPALRTGSDGRAQVRFNFPDSLTTWRTTIRAVTADSKFGSEVNKVIVRKNVMVRLVVPRFFRRGDEVTVSTIVHNYLANSKTARVSLDVKGLEIASGATQDVTVPSRGDVKVDWRLKATTTASEAKLLTKALTNEESDAMELTLPIVPFGIKMAAARSGILTVNGEKSEQLAFPDKIDLASRKLQIDVTPSIAGTIFSALDYLTSYPYGCTEQTMSSFLPNIVVQRAMKDLNLKSNVDQADLDKKIRAGLDRLYDYQHPTGGWGWWKTDDDHYFMSAYVLSGLAQAKQSGYSVKDDSYKIAQQYLRKAFDANPRALADLRAYAAYALAQSGITDRAPLDAVWNQRSDLSPYGKAMLGLALELANDSRAAQLADDVERGAKVTELEAHWELSRDPLLDFYGDNSPEATAYALRFLAHQRPKSDLLPKAAFWLVNHRDEGYFWESTKQTAMVIYGLTDYLKISGELNPNFTAEVAVNGRVVLTRKFTSSTDLQSPITLSADQLQPGANTIRVKKTGEGRLYWSARAEWHSTDDKLANTGNLQINMTREYYKLTSERSGDKIVYRMDLLSGPVQVGDILAVHDVVSGADWKYVMLEDPIPAGTEFIERDDLYELKIRPNWWGWGYARREFHDDRAGFFITYFNKREEFRYLLKVVNPGLFKVSPARVGPMYQPSMFATSESQTLEVK